MIKLIIFDAYGVCLTGGYMETAKFLAKKFKREAKEIYTVLYTKYFNLAAEKKITQQAAWERGIKELSLPLSANRAKKIHYDLMGLNKKTLELARELKNNYQILLLSKNTRSQLKDINDRFPRLKKVFGQNIINTWEYGLPKASRKTIKYILNKHGVAPGEVVYTDDQEQNLLAASELGVHTILFKTFAQFKKELNQILYA